MHSSLTVPPPSTKPFRQGPPNTEAFRFSLVEEFCLGHTGPSGSTSPSRERSGPFGKSCFGNNRHPRIPFEVRLFFLRHSGLAFEMMASMNPPITIRWYFIRRLFGSLKDRGIFLFHWANRCRRVDFPFH